MRVRPTSRGCWSPVCIFRNFMNTLIPLHIREATQADAPELNYFMLRLESEALPTIYSLQHRLTIESELAAIKRLSDSPNSLFLLAEHNGQIVGAMDLQGMRHPQCVHVGYVGISVCKDHRGKGIGNAMFDALFQRAPQLGVARLELEVFANNPRAIVMYERLGFQIDGFRPGIVRVGEEFVDVVLMSREV